MKMLKAMVLMLVGLAMVAAVQAEDVQKHEWHFSPYVWLPSMDVTSKVPGLPAGDINLGFDDIWENFDLLAISARGEYWWGQFGFVLDGLWMDMQADGLGPSGNLDVQITDGIVDTLAAYRFNLGGSGPTAASMRVMAGGRYHYLKQELTGPVTTRGGSRDWFEPVVGAQVLAPFSEKWMATLRGDVGGFGVADASELTWSAMAGVGWSFAENWMAKAGYRYYYIDYTDGSGLQAFGLEGNMHGPWIGIAYGQ